jgi:hypothetical protein
MNIYDKSYISKKATDSGFNRDTYEKVLRLVDVKCNNDGNLETFGFPFLIYFDMNGII